MASSSGIVLKVSQPFQNVRLLELPDDLLNIITSDEQNVEQLLLKASPSTGDSSTGQQGNLHLCSNEKTWLIKQVSTSNSVYVTRSSESDVESMVAFAKPSSVLELHPVKADFDSVVETHLKRLIPTVADPVLEVGQSHFAKAQLYNEIPASKNAISRIFGHNCVFELPWSSSKQTPHPGPARRAFIPGPSLLLEVWRNIVEAATISETKIQADLEADMLLDAFAEPRSSAEESNVFKAVAKAMFAAHGYFETLGIIVCAAQPDMKDKLNEMDLARWVGNLILKVTETTASEPLEKEAFETRWEDIVPAYLSKYCSVEVLGRSCNVRNDGHKDIMQWQEFSIASKEVGSVDTSAKLTAPTSKGKRKWHDKFAATRTVKG